MKKKKKKSNLKVDNSGNFITNNRYSNPYNPIGYLCFESFLFDVPVFEEISWFRKAMIRIFIGGTYRKVNNG